MISISLSPVFVGLIALLAVPCLPAWPYSRRWTYLPSMILAFEFIFLLLLKIAFG